MSAMYQVCDTQMKKLIEDLLLSLCAGYFLGHILAAMGPF